jgi:hypothetical protein
MIATFALLLAAAGGPPPSLTGARPDLPPRLRSPAEVLGDYVKAVGGPAAWKRHKNIHMKHKVEVKGMQIAGIEDRYATYGDKILSIMSLGAMGSFRQGCDGKVAWSEDPINGLRILEGAEAEEAKIEATWNSDLQVTKLYQKVRAVQPPEPAPAGKKYDCLELVPKLAKPVIACFDAETHLRTFQKGTHATAQGDVPFKEVFSDWRQVDGMTLPYADETTAGPVTIISQVTELKFDEKLDPKMFQLPKIAKPSKAVKPAQAAGDEAVQLQKN